MTPDEFLFRFHRLSEEDRVTLIDMRYPGEWRVETEEGGEMVGGGSFIFKDAIHHLLEREMWR